MKNGMIGYVAWLTLVFLWGGGPALRAADLEASQNLSSGGTGAFEPVKLDGRRRSRRPMGISMARPTRSRPWTERPTAVF
jgi:hypothetical protein